MRATDGATTVLARPLFTGILPLPGTCAATATSLPGVIGDPERSLG